MLNPRLIAIQGLNFSPIQVAIQGLLALIVEEQQNVVGGGGRARGTAGKKSAPKRTPQAHKTEKSYTDADIRRIVEEKYQIIEAKREAKPDPAPKVEPIADAKEVVEPKPVPHLPVSIALPKVTTPLAIDLPKLTTVVTPVDRAAKLAKAQSDAEAARLAQEQAAKEAKAKRDEAAIVMLLMEL